MCVSYFARNWKHRIQIYSNRHASDKRHIMHEKVRLKYGVTIRRHRNAVPLSESWAKSGKHYGLRLRIVFFSATCENIAQRFIRQTMTTLLLRALSRSLWLWGVVDAGNSKVAHKQWTHSFCCLNVLYSIHFQGKRLTGFLIWKNSQIDGSSRIVARQKDCVHPLQLLWVDSMLWSDSDLEVCHMALVRT